MRTYKTLYICVPRRRHYACFSTSGPACLNTRFSIVYVLYRLTHEKHKIQFILDRILQNFKPLYEKEKLGNHWEHISYMVYSTKILTLGFKQRVLRRNDTDQKSPIQFTLFGMSHL